MDIFGVGVGELLVILVIAMMVVGPERMVELASDLGRFLRQFRSTTDEVTKEFREAFTLEVSEGAEGEGSGEAAASAGQKTAAAHGTTEAGGTQAAKAATPAGSGATPTEPGAPGTSGTPLAAPAAASNPAWQIKDKAGAGPAGDGDGQGAAQKEAATEVAGPTTDELAEEPAAAAAPERQEEPVQAVDGVEGQEGVEEVGDLSDLLGSAFAMGEADVEEDEEEARPASVPASEGAGEAAKGCEEDQVAERRDLETAGETDVASATEEATAGTIVPEAPSEEAAPEPEITEEREETEETGLNAPIPTFGLDLGLEEAPEVSGPADRSEQEG